MSRLVVAILTILASFLATMALPTPPSADTLLLEKRTDHTGRGTWFDPGLGNCGSYNTRNDPILAISKKLYDDNNSGNCNQWVRIVNNKNGKVAYGQTKDSCPGCGENDLDMSPALFQQLGSLDTGVLQITWHFEAKGWHP